MTEFVIFFPGAVQGWCGVSTTYASVPFDGNGAMNVMHAVLSAVAARDDAFASAFRTQPLPGNVFMARAGDDVPPVAHFDRVLDSANLMRLHVGIFKACAKHNQRYSNKPYGRAVFSDARPHYKHRHLFIFVIIFDMKMNTRKVLFRPCLCMYLFIALSRLPSLGG